jgi:uncharacterized protein (DUF433 family)
MPSRRRAITVIYVNARRGASQHQILANYPQLEPDDFLAVYAYAAELAAGNKVSRG